MCRIRSPQRRSTGSRLTAAAALALYACVGAAAESEKLFAAPAATAAPPDGLSSLGQVTIALLLVLAAVFAAAWMLRRLKLFAQRGGRHLEILGEIAVGAKERAVLLKVGDKRVLVGVAPGSVTALHVLNADELPDDAGSSGVSTDPNNAGTATPSFKALLRQGLGLK